MQILGINNYYQPRYTNINKQGKKNNTQNVQTTPQNFTFTGIRVNGFKNIHEFKNIKNPENRAFFEELKKKFREVPYYTHSSLDCGYEGIPSYIIKKVYESCLDSNNVVNKYAAQVLFNICHVSDVPVKELDIPEWHIKEEKSNVFEEWGIDGVEALLSEVKDKNGNHNLNNLKFLLYFDKKYDLGSVPSDVTSRIQQCMNEDGIVTEKNAQRFKSIYEQPFGEWLSYSAKDIMDTSETGMAFINRMLKYIKNTKNKQVYFNPERENITNLTRAVLEYNKSKEADKVFNILLENSDLIVKSLGDDFLSILDKHPIVEKSFNSKKQISSYNLQKVVEFIKNDEDELLENIDFLKDKSGYIRNENIEAYKKISEYIFDDEGRYGAKQLTELNKFECFRTENNIINKEFVDNFIELCDKNDIHSPMWSVQNLFHILNLFGKNKIDWEVTDTLCKYSRKALNTGKGTEVIYNNNDQVFNYVFDNKNKQIKSENLKLFKKFADLDNVNEWTNFAILEGQINTSETLQNFIKENSSEYKNLYTAEDMLELLRDMSEEGILDCEMMTIPIGEGDIPLLMYIADILPTEENSKKYDKIVRILKNVAGINYNYKDKLGVSFIEKVLMSENEKLLDLIKNEPLEYYPELDYAFDNIQNQEFKDKVKELNFVFSDLEKAVTLRSNEAVNKLKAQFKSPLFNEKVLKRMLDNAIESGDKDFCRNIINQYRDSADKVGKNPY